MWVADTRETSILVDYSTHQGDLPAEQGATNITNATDDGIYWSDDDDGIYLNISTEPEDVTDGQTHIVSHLVDAMNDASMEFDKVNNQTHTTTDAINGISGIIIKTMENKKKKYICQHCGNFTSDLYFFTLLQ